MNEFPEKELRKSSNWGSLMCVAFTVLVGVGAKLLKMLLALFIDKDSASFSDIFSGIAFLYQYLIIVPLLLVLFRMLPYGKTTPKLKPLFCKPQQSKWWIFRWIVIGVGFSYMASAGSAVLITLINTLTPIELHTINMSFEPSILSMLGTAVPAAILAPIFEEFMMRGAVYNDHKRYCGWSAIIINGIIFGLWHNNISQTLLAFCLGAVSAFLINKTKSIYPSIIMHFILNSVSSGSAIIMSVFGLGNNTSLAEILKNSEETGIDTSTLISILVTLCMSGVIMLFIIGSIVFIILEIMSHRDSFKVETPYPEVSEGKKFLTWITTPGFIIFFLMSLVITTKTVMGW